MTTLFIDSEPQFLEGPPGAFVPLAEVDALEALIAALQAENTRLRTCLFKDTRSLKRMAKTWYTRAGGHYCQTYNPGMAQGLTGAADMLEDYLSETRRALGE